MPICHPTDCSTPGFPVHHQLLEPVQTHVHQVALLTMSISSNHLILCCPLLLLPSGKRSILKHQSFPISQFFASGGQSIGASVSALVLPMNIQGLFPRIDWFALLAIQGTLKNLLQHHNLKASLPQCSVFCMVQFTSIHDYWKNHCFDCVDLCGQSNVSAF